jgi:hypothetical protein
MLHVLELYQKEPTIRPNKILHSLRDKLPAGIHYTIDLALKLLLHFNFKLHFNFNFSLLFYIYVKLFYVLHFCYFRY